MDDSRAALRHKARGTGFQGQNNDTTAERARGLQQTALQTRLVHIRKLPMHPFLTASTPVNGIQTQMEPT
jgi:hypothetical protein